MLRARRAYVRNGGDREPSPGLCSEPFERAPRPTRCVAGPGYNTVTGPRRDDFPNNFVGDLVYGARLGGRAADVLPSRPRVQSS